MDGRGRLAEPLTDGAPSRATAGVAAPRRLFRFGPNARIKLPRFIWRWAGPLVLRRVPRGAGVTAASLLLSASIGYGVLLGGHGEAFVAELRDARDAIANMFGFRITSIALAGGKQVTREEILTTAGVTGRTSLLFLDPSEARSRLKTNPWIAEATVLKLYPGRLHIAVTERQAFALWQKAGKVSVIADDGTIVEPFVAKRFASLPLVVGQGAETRAKEFLALIDRYPLLRDQVRASVLVAERRWNLKLKSGLDVRLPEANVERALDTLVELDRDKKLLSRDITMIDMRLSDRVTVRLSDEAAAARDDALKPQKPKRKGGDA
jgi:cell division protein FtsQ